MFVLFLFSTVLFNRFKCVVLHSHQEQILTNISSVTHVKQMLSATGKKNNLETNWSILLHTFNIFNHIQQLFMKNYIPTLESLLENYWGINVLPKVIFNYKD